MGTLLAGRESALQKCVAKVRCKDDYSKGGAKRHATPRPRIKGLRARTPQEGQRISLVGRSPPRREGREDGGGRRCLVEYG